MRTVSTCAWVSSSCDLLHPIEEYCVRVGALPERVELLCRFHGQFWPKVGESREETTRRTKRARVRMTASDQRKADYQRRAESRRRAHETQRRQRRAAQDVSLPNEET